MARRARRRHGSRVNMTESAKPAAEQEHETSWVSSSDESDEGMLELRTDRAQAARTKSAPVGSEPAGAHGSAPQAPSHGSNQQQSIQLPKALHCDSPVDLVRSASPTSQAGSLSHAAPRSEAAALSRPDVVDKVSPQDMAAHPDLQRTETAAGVIRAPATPKRSETYQHSSPVPSNASLRSSRSTLLLRTPVAPVLDTHRVAGAHFGATGFGTGPAGVDIDAGGDADMDASIDSLPAGSLRPVGSTSALAQEASHEVRPQFMRGRTDSVSSLTSLVERASLGMRRTSSSQSLNEANLRRIESSPSCEQLEMLLERGRGRGASRLVSRGVTNEHSGPVRMSAAGTNSRLAATSISHMLASARRRAPKLLVSKFAGYHQQFDPHAPAMSVPTGVVGTDGVPGRVMSADVPAQSVYAPDFIARLKGKTGRDGASRQPPTGEPTYRYLLDYALSGPPIERGALSEVDLTPRLESGVPLRDTRAKLAVPESTTTLGPNMIPFHFIHALTSTMDNALALDQAEVPAMASLLPGVSDALDDASAPSTSDLADERLHFIDNPSMRAIAYTAEAVAVQRMHSVTRRFADPSRAALTRVMRESSMHPRASMARTRGAAW